MVLVRTIDGKIHIVDNWGMSKFDTDIEKVFLTDGDKIVKSLQTCEGYLVDREHIVTQPDGPRQVHRRVKETIYGFRNLDANKQDLSDVYLEELERLKKLYGNKPNYKDILRRSDILYKQMLNTIESKEISFIALEQTEGEMKLSKLSVSYHPKHIKKGTSTTVSNNKLLGKGYRRKFRI